MVTFGVWHSYLMQRGFFFLLVCCWFGLFFKAKHFFGRLFSKYAKKKKIINITKHGVMSILGLIVGCRSITKRKKKKNKTTSYFFFSLLRLWYPGFPGSQSGIAVSTHCVCITSWLFVWLDRQRGQNVSPACQHVAALLTRQPADRPTDRLQLHSSVSSVKRKQLLLVTAAQNWWHPLPKSKLYL